MSQDDETAALLTPSREPTPANPAPDNDSNSDAPSDDTSSSSWSITKTARRLYVSHFLSTCNSRVFEFGSVLYLATIFPGTLLPMSVYAVARGASAILLSSVVGQYIDTGNRLKVVRLSIGKCGEDDW